MSGDDTHDAVQVPPEEPQDSRGWIRRHPYWTGIIALLVLTGLDLAMLPFGTLASYRDNRPEVTSFQRADLDRQRAAGKKPHLRKEWIAYRSIPRHVVRAVLVSEDASFWQHSGFDAFEIHQSVMDAVTEGKDLRGASTITQQLVKNLFLSPSKDPLRKFHETVLTLVAEQVLGKRRILELYLNEIEWGPGVYGVQAASRHYFGKSVASIDPREAAFLAAIIPNPTAYTPDRPTPYLDRRMVVILRRMGVEVDAPDSTALAAPDTLAVQDDRLSSDSSTFEKE